MTYQPLYLVPGICKVDSNYSLGQPFNFVEGRYAKGRYASGNLYRFTAGFPEKLGGWVSFITAGLVGIVRAMRPWLDYNFAIETCIGTESHLYTYLNGTLTDITPVNFLSVGTLTNPFTTANGSPVVAVADSSQKLQNGDFVLLVATSAVGGLMIAGYYQVSGRTGSGYNITLPTNATSTQVSGGGTTSFAYPRYNLTNPFAMTNGSPIVTVTDTGHQAQTGDYVTFSGASAYQGLTISGQYQLTKIDANTYTITASGNATGTGGAGGGTVSTVHNISLSSSSISVPSNYGAGAYGSGPYGYSFGSISVGQVNWSLFNYGYLMMACPVGGTIYVYDPSVGGRAYPLYNAPTQLQAFVITPERFIIALGTANSPLQLAWADQNTPTVWTALATNTANSGRTLIGGNKFVAGLPVMNGLTLVFSDRSVFALQYTGNATIYNSPLVADNAGLLATNAAVAEGGVAWWMSDADFWTYNGSVQALPSDDIRDYVFNEDNQTALNPSYKNKTAVGMNRQKREVWFFYVSQASTEIDSYVIYHTDQQCFSTGMLSRTAWVDSQLLATPIGSDALGNVYNHEVGNDANGTAMDSYIQTGPIDVSNGEVSIDVMGFTPDFERLTGTVNLTVLTRYYPQDSDTVNGPYAIAAVDQAPIVDIRADGRMVAAKIESNQIGGDYRLGLMRFDIKPAGARR